MIKKAADNDGELTDINLNNIKYISDEKWRALFACLKENSNVESLSAANCSLTDPLCNLLCECLEVMVVMMAVMVMGVVTVTVTVTVT